MFLKPIIDIDYFEEYLSEERIINTSYTIRLLRIPIYRKYTSSFGFTKEQPEQQEETNTNLYQESKIGFKNDKETVCEPS